MAYQLSPHQIEEIQNKLPPQFAALKDKYPVSISNAADDWDLPSYPQGYVPETIEIYYEDEADNSDLFVRNGQLVSLNLKAPIVDPTVIMMDIDGNWAYIQLEGRVILNRIGGAVLPDVLTKPEMLLQASSCFVSE